MSNNKQFNNQQLQRQERKQIQKLFEDEKQKIQKQTNQNNNIIQLQALQLIQDQTIKKCNYCNYQGTKELVLKRTKNSHPKEFLSIKNNNDEYSICQTCNKMFLKKNIDQHDFLCRFKDNNKKASKAMNNINKLREKNIYYKTQSSEDQNNFYNNLLSREFKMRELFRPEEKISLLQPKTSILRGFPQKASYLQIQKIIIEKNT